MDTEPHSSDNPVAEWPVRLRRIGRDEIAALNRRFAAADPSAAIAWAVGRFGRRLVLASSFADTLLIDMATRIDPGIEVVFLDTGFHFPETLTTVQTAVQRYRLNLRVLGPDPDARSLWVDGVAACCEDRKTGPLSGHLLAHADAWMSGLRRDDSPDRAAVPVIGVDRRGLIKINPLVVWDTDQLNRYATDHAIVVNPLTDQGYSSIGCWPCTTVPTDADDPRSGRWPGTDRTECGIHT